MSLVSGRALNRWIDRRRTIYPAELEALEGAALGETHEQTARRLFKSPHTIERQLLNARRKLGARNIAHAVALAVARGFLELELPPEAEVARLGRSTRSRSHPLHDRRRRR